MVAVCSIDDTFLDYVKVQARFGGQTGEKVIGHHQIIEYRQKGKKPTYVTVRYGDEPEKMWHGDDPEKRMRNGFPPIVYINEGEFPDIRFLTGCNVLFESDRSTEDGNRIVKKIIEQKPKQLIYATKEREFGIWKGGKWDF